MPVKATMTINGDKMWEREPLLTAGGRGSAGAAIIEISEENSQSVKNKPTI